MKFTHRHLDGEWNRLLPDGALEMRDPNDGQGFDPDDKRRHQYRVIGGAPHSRALPPESVGDTWRGETGPPDWEPMTHPVPGRSLLADYLDWAAAHPAPGAETVAAVIPTSGREVRLTPKGYEVQPWNDNYWVAVPSLEEAIRIGTRPAPGNES